VLFRSGDPLVFATANVAFNQLVLTARQSGAAGESVSYSISFSAGAQLSVASTSGQLSGGRDAAKIAPGTLVSILGENLSEKTESVPANSTSFPTTLGDVEVYIDGLRAPLSYVSPTQINAQMPWDVNDASSVSAYVRIKGSDGVVRTTTATGVPIIPANPGLFAQAGTDPRPATAVHGSSSATGVVSVDGAIKAGDVGTITIADRTYTYTVTADDTLVIVRDALINSINQDEQVTASAAAVYTRIILKSRTLGKEGEGLTYGASVTEGGSLILTPLTTTLCCSNEEGAPITEDNPAVPGETILVYGTGLGIVQPDEAKFAQVNGGAYGGPEVNAPNSPVDAIAGGKTANVLSAGLKQGQIGIYELRLQLNSDLPTNPQTQLTIAQDVYISNIVAFPLVNPNPPAETTPAP